MGVTDEIKSRIDIVDFISAYVSLRKAGRNYKGLCPFHHEKTPSFVVFPDNQSWHCFGACGVGGDVFGFLMKKENLSFPEALQVLAQRAGIELAPQTPERKAAEERRDRMFEINEAAAEYFHTLLKTAEAAQVAREYLDRRSITAETVDAFALGYSLNDWHALQNHLTAKGYRIEELSQLGLSIERDSGGYYDRFRGRLIFPIRDAKGRVVAFAGRVLDGSEPKYMNSPESSVFSKGQLLYGFDRARTAIREANLAVIVEGYMDALMAHQHGIANVVASMGTSLTEVQLRSLGRLTKRIALALDADAAGSSATLRGLGVAREALDRDVVPVPTQAGLVQYESRLKVELLIVSLPAGKDPDDVIKEGRDKWDAFLAHAKPLVEYYFEAVCAPLDLSSPKGKSEAVQQLSPIIREVGDSIERSHYVQRLARLVHMDDRELLAIVEAGGRTARRVRQTREATPSESAAARPSCEEWVALLVQKRPDAVAETVERMAENSLPGPEIEDLTETSTRELVSALWQPLADGRGWSEVEAALPPVLSAHLHELEQRWPAAPAIPDDQVADQLIESWLRLRQQRLQQTVMELKFLQTDAVEAHDQEAASQYARMVAQNSSVLGAVQRALGTRPWRRRPEREEASEVGASTLGPAHGEGTQ